MGEFTSKLLGAVSGENVSSNPSYSRSRASKSFYLGNIKKVLTEQYSVKTEICSHEFAEILIRHMILFTGYM